MVHLPGVAVGVPRRGVVTVSGCRLLMQDLADEAVGKKRKSGLLMAAVSLKMESRGRVCHSVTEAKP